ncbi:CHAP domain-containing protein [Brevibacillus dissolubilis]|uniref:CHAP domain-containing protein n=1 Tax=Brevibacillus dissolubilis TaxID=1844116 RepID=UPI00159BC3FC|nr:CHAP domain-containing protein [Brevibacillus dissolubilis]
MKKQLLTMTSAVLLVSAVSVPSFAMTGNNPVAQTQAIDLGSAVSQQSATASQGLAADHSFSVQGESFGVDVQGLVDVDTVGTDDYPYKNDSWNQADPWLFYKRECVSFVAWRMNNDQKVSFSNYMAGPNGKSGHWGNANNWDDNARLIGYTVDKIPAVGSVAQWNSGTYGHVAYVQSVSADKSTITVEEYNKGGTHVYGKRTILASSVENFIHIKDSGATGIKGTVNTSGISLNVRSGPGTSYSIVGSVADGASVTIKCQKRGESVTGTYGTTTLWDNIGSGYVSDAYVYTGSDGQVAPTCP